MQRLFSLMLLPACLLAVYFSHTQGKKPAAVQLRVMTYNIHHCNPPSQDGKIDVDAVVQAIRQADPDLLALQEVDVNTGRSGNIDQASIIAAKLDMHYYFGKAIDYDGGEYGVAVLSRFPISEMETHRLPTLEGSGGEARVMATARVTLPNGSSIRFASTHLDAQQAHENRLLQISKIREIAEKEPLPLVLAGDINAVPGSEVIAIMDAFLERSCQLCPPTIPVLQPEKAIDFIAFRKKHDFEVLQHEVIPETYASDHRPVIAVLQVSDMR
jgi:endonuclease/exonuclease/phosphatase family metal-dependent hydrolase